MEEERYYTKITTNTRSFNIKEPYEEAYKLMLELPNELVTVTEIYYYGGSDTAEYEAKVTLRAKDIIEVSVRL